MVVRDFEAAMVGDVTYRVVDGDGHGEATVTADQGEFPDPGPSLSLPTTAHRDHNLSAPDYAHVTMTITYDEASDSQGTVHVVLGRTDRLSNPGTLLDRTGTLELFCTTFEQAAAVRDLLSDARVAYFRQPDYPGMDFYFVCRGLRTTHTSEPTNPRRWLVTIAYDEVVSP